MRFCSMFFVLLLAGTIIGCCLARSTKMERNGISALDFDEQNGGRQIANANVDENRTFMLRPGQELGGKTGTEKEAVKGAATCYDYRLATFINTGLRNYGHDMGQLAGYIMNQIQLARYPGYFLVHAQKIGGAGQRQGYDWQSNTNGNLFQPSSQYGCYFHDTVTYIIIVRYG